MRDDGDLVKAIGRVCINFAYLEDELDEVIKFSKPLFSYKPNLLKYQFSAKVEFLKKEFTTAYKQYPNTRDIVTEKPQAFAILSECKLIADERNNLLHSAIRGDNKGNAFQIIKDRHSRKKIEEKSLTSQYVYELAEDIFALGGDVYGLTFSLKNLLEQKMEMQNVGL